MSGESAGGDTHEQEIDELVASEKLAEAGERCLSAGRFDDATNLFARANRYDRAAEAARRGGDLAAAMLHASRATTAGTALDGSSDDLTSRFGLLRELSDAIAPDAARGVAETLVARGLSVGAAFAFARSGDSRRAGEQFERAGQLLLAADAFQTSGDTAEAARVLTAIRAQDPAGDDASRAGLSLGRLLADAGRLPQAARVLQSVVERGGERHAVLAKQQLATILEQMGLREARRSLGEVAPSSPVATPASSAPAESHARTLLGRYEVHRTVASSPSAQVLEATDRLTNERVAVKLLVPTSTARGRDARARFEREAEALRTLRHPHVVPLLRFHPDGPAAVFPWQSGGSLADALRDGALASGRASEVALHLLAALGAAHSAGILHRDVKPANVLFDGTSSARLSDFGAAHLGEGDTTVTAGLIGSLVYMAPEQLAAEQASAESDIFAVGAVLYESLTGLPPRPSDELDWWPSDAYPGELLASHDHVIRHMLARDRAARPATAREAAEAIVALPWVTRGPLQRPARAVASAVQVADERLRRIPHSSSELYRDERLGRAITIAPASQLAVARAVAAADSPAIELVLRVDPATELVWIERAEGPTLADAPRSPQLSTQEAWRLGEALGALHRAGGVHGAIDEHHVVRTTSGVMWRFPLRSPESPPTIDDETRAAEAQLRAWTTPT